MVFLYFYFKLFTMPIPSTYSSKWLTDRAIALGYTEELKNGICFGLAMMGQTAFLMDELALFDKRLLTISNCKISFFQNAARQIKTSKSYSEIEPFIMECLAFFDPLSLYQLPSSHEAILGENLTQRMVRKTRWLLPEAQQNTLYELKPFSGVYNLFELENYFILIKTYLDQFKIQRCSLILECGDHSIQIGYNHDTQEWSMVDSLSLPSRQISNIEILAFSIFNSFYNGEEDATKIAKEAATSIFSTTMTVNIDYQEPFAQAYEKLYQDPLWIKIHQVNSAKALMTDSMQYSWLTLACFVGEEDVVGQLLAHPDVNVNQLSMQNSFPLYIATLNQKLPVLQRLLQDPRVDLTLSIPTQATSFLIACQQDSIDIVNAYLQHPDIEKVINQPSLDNDVPIYAAIAEKKKDIFCSLLTHAEMINPNIITSDGHAPLHLLCNDGDLDMLTAFCKIPRINFEIRDPDQRTPFMIACQLGHIALAKWLFEHCHVNINAIDTNRSCALLTAIESKKAGVISFLLSLPGIAQDIQDINDDTPFICACRLGDLNTMRMLILNGCNVLLKNVDGLTGFEILIQMKAWEPLLNVIPLLKASGAWTNVQRSLSPISRQTLGALITKLQQQRSLFTAQAQEVMTDEESHRDKKIKIENTMVQPGPSAK